MKNEKKSKEFRLSYLAQTLQMLFKIWRRLVLKNYALKNSTAAQETSSLASKTDNLRIERTTIEYFVLAKLSKIVNRGTDISKYEALRLETLYDDALDDFRMSETIRVELARLRNHFKCAIRSKTD